MTILAESDWSFCSDAVVSFSAEMIKRRGDVARLPPTISCRAIQRAGIALYLANGGTVGIAKQIAGFASALSIIRYESSNAVPTARDIDRIAI